MVSIHHGRIIDRTPESVVVKFPRIFLVEKLKSCEQIAACLRDKIKRSDLVGEQKLALEKEYDYYLCQAMHLCGVLDGSVDTVIDL